MQCNPNPNPNRIAQGRTEITTSAYEKGAFLHLFTFPFIGRSQAMICPNLSSIDYDVV